MLTPERVAELLADPDVVELLAIVGRVSREISRTQLLADIEAAGRAAAIDAAKTVWRRPPHAEMQQRRHGAAWNRGKYIPVQDEKYQALRRRKGIVGPLAHWVVDDSAVSTS